MAENNQQGFNDLSLVEQTLKCALATATTRFTSLAPSWTPACAGVTVWAAKGCALSCHLDGGTWTPSDVERATIPKRPVIPAQAGIYVQ
ncbi:MAG TPA: hypothetical protein DCM48_22090 [Thalassospira sp.]|nr:hypothetical protein [Thalassospira sp.]